VVVLERNQRPLYAQLRDELQGQIVSQSIPPGAPLPTEEELQDKYKVSRSVVRQALGELADRGLIVRQRGRGTVVAPRHEHHRRATQAGGLRQQFASAGQELKTRVVSLTVEEPPAPAVAELGTTNTWRLERVRFVDDEPVIYMSTWLPIDLFPTLTAEELDGGSLHDWMRSVGHPPQGGPRQIEAVTADSVVTTHLACRRGDALLLLQGITKDAYGRGLEWFQAWHRPHTVFDIDATVDPLTPAAMDLTRARALLGELQQLLNHRGN
jgi:GntR family transcriptional regulator